MTANSVPTVLKHRAQVQESLVFCSYAGLARDRRFKIRDPSLLLDGCERFCCPVDPLDNELRVKVSHSAFESPLARYGLNQSVLWGPPGEKWGSWGFNNVCFGELG